MSDADLHHAYTTCLQALYTLYGGNTGNIAPANQWLVQFQRERMLAWRCADMMLRAPDLPSHAYYFAANLLYTKLLVYFHELADKNQREAFRSALLQHILTHITNPSTSSSLRTKLCLCGALLTIHLIGLNEWPYAIEEWSRILKDRRRELMDVLTFMPEVRYTIICIVLHSLLCFSHSVTVLLFVCI